MNILYEPFPDKIVSDGTEYEILTDFREWLRFSDLIADKTVDATDKLRMMAQWIVSPIRRMTAETVNALFSFYRAEAIEMKQQASEEEPHEETEERPPVFDWKVDAKYVLADFLRCYGLDLLSVPYLHWFHFRSLFAALPDDSMTAKRISYRGTDLGKIKDPSQRAEIARIQKQIALPYEYTDEMIGAMLWNTL